MPGVERGCLDELKGKGEGGAKVARRFGVHAAPRIDGNRNSCVRGTEQPAIIFYSAHPCHVQVLPGRPGISVPAIIRDIDKNLRTIFGELANFVTEDALIADEDTVAATLRGKDIALGSRVHVTHAFSQFLRKGEEALERDVLSPGDKVDLVVTSLVAARPVEE